MWIAKLKFPKTLRKLGRKFEKGMPVGITADQAEVLRKDERFIVYGIDEAHLHETTQDRSGTMIPRKSVRRNRHDLAPIDTAETRRRIPEAPADDDADAGDAEGAGEGEGETNPNAGGETPPSEPQDEISQGSDEAPKGGIKIVRKAKTKDQVTAVDPSTAGAVEI